MKAATHQLLAGGRKTWIRRRRACGRLTGGDVGGGVGVGQSRHLAGQTGLAGPAVETQVGDPG